MWEVDKDLLKISAAAAAGTAVVFGIAKLAKWASAAIADSGKKDDKDEKK